MNKLYNRSIVMNFHK